MKTLSILLSLSLLLACETNLGEKLGEGARDILDRLEARAIRAMFDGVEPSELGDEVFFVIIGCSDGYLRPIVCRPADAVAWFKLAHDKERVRLDYVSFPRQEEYGGPCDDDRPRKRLAETLTKIVKDRGVADIQNVKHFRMFTPETLKNNAMLDYMLRAEQSRRVTLHGSNYFWGFKTKEKEMIAYSNYYSDEFLALVEKGVLEYVMDAVFHYDTPDEWKIKYISEWKSWAYPHEYEVWDDRICYYDPRLELLARVTK
jgi:hypothetical protein